MGLVGFLEQSKQDWEDCSKREELFKAGVGAKQAGFSRLLQVRKGSKKLTWSNKKKEEGCSKSKEIIEKRQGVTEGNNKKLLQVGRNNRKVCRSKEE